LVIVVILLGVTASCRWPWQPIAAEFTSPKGTYTARLRGHLSAPQSFFFVHVVSLEVLKGGDLFVDAHEIHSADSFDTAFEDLYKGHRWLSESTLQIKSTGGMSQSDVLEQVVVENQSSKAVRFLRVQVNDLFLLLDLAPRSVNTLFAPHRDDWCWVDVAGVWADGSPLPERSADFSHPMSGTRHIRIVIDERGIQIR
jgi:hypothetical protein